ncbi:MAG TPA: 5'-3' exonuclease H3TH domain-containing protein [Solirubrobacteraceae bacterium]|nr:5'-3' exonuclease H3TH domain-containing protein [Solirubrobacteraceae bacterium]
MESAWPATPLLVLDTPWLLYRAFFGLPRSIRDGGGEPRGALLGLVNTVLAAIDACHPRAVVCCFGAEEADYRVALYPPYHAHRDPMPAELRAQWVEAPALLGEFGWTVAEHATLEADDLLGSFAQTEREAGGETLIFTGDRDLYQAVDTQTGVLALSRDKPAARLGVEHVRSACGVEPAQIPDLIALRGDPSDGIPGAKGVGAKTAAELLATHGNLEGVLAAATSPTAAARGLRPRIAEALRTQADELRRFLEIATLVDVEVDLPADAPTDLAGGGRAAGRYGMERLAARLADAAAQAEGRAVSRRDGR